VQKSILVLKMSLRRARPALLFSSRNQKIYFLGSSIEPGLEGREPKNISSQKGIAPLDDTFLSAYLMNKSHSIIGYRQ